MVRSKTAATVCLLIFWLLIPVVVAAQDALERDVAFVFWQTESSDYQGRAKWLYEKFAADEENALMEFDLWERDLESQLYYLGPRAIPYIKRTIDSNPKKHRYWDTDLLYRPDGPPPMDKKLSYADYTEEQWAALFPLSDEQLRSLAEKMMKNSIRQIDQPILFKTYGEQLSNYLIDSLKDSGKAKAVFERQMEYARPYLSAALDHPEPRCRFWAAVLLTEAGDTAEKLTPALLWGLEHGYWYEAGECLATLKRGSREAVRIIQPWLRDDRFGKRTSALELLAKVAPGEKETLAAIDEGLASWDNNMYIAAIRAIGFQGRKGKRYVPLLLDIFQNGNHDASGNALRALGELGPVARAAKPTLLKLKGNYWDFRFRYVSLEDRRKDGQLPIDKDIFIALGKIDRKDKNWHKEFTEYLFHIIDTNERGDIYYDVLGFSLPDEYYLNLADKLLAGDSPVDKMRAVCIYKSFSDEANVKKMISLFYDSPQLDQTAIVEAIVTFQEKAIPFVEPLLQDDKRHVRLAAVRVLGGLNKKPLAQLRAAVRNDDERVRSEAWRVLLDYKTKNDQLITDILRALQDSSEDVRALAIDAMAFPHHKEFVPLLVTALDDPSAKVRAHAVRRLGYFGLQAKENAPRVLEFLNDPDKKIAKNAKLAFTRFGPSALPLLHPDLSDFSNPRRQRVALEIVFQNAPFAGEEFPYVLGLAKQGDKNLRRAAMQCLFLMAPAPAESAPRLIELLSADDPLIRLAAMSLLSEIKPADRALQNVFRQALQDPKLEMRLLATAGLIENGKDVKQGRQRFLAALTGKSKSERKAAARIVAALGADAAFAVPALIEMAKESVFDRVAEKALIAIGSAATPQILTVFQGDDYSAKRIATVVCEDMDTIDPRLVPFLIEMLKDKRWANHNAARALAKVDPATPGLIAALGRELQDEDDDWELGEMLVKMSPQGLAEVLDHNFSVRLAHSGIEDVLDERYYSVLMQKLDTDDEKKLEIIRLMINDIYRKEEIPFASTYINGTPRQRRALCRLAKEDRYLSGMKVDDLYPMLDNPILEERLAAANMILLIKNGDRRAQQTLLSLVQGADRRERLAACQTIADLEKIDNSLIGALEDLFSDDADPEVSDAALRALTSVGNYDSFSLKVYSERLVLALLAKAKNGAGDTELAAKVFNEMQPAAFPYLVAELRTADPAQRDRLLLLASPRNRLDGRYLPLITKTMGDKNKAVRLAAIRMMGRVNMDSADATLMSLLADKDADVQTSAVFALRSHGDGLLWEKELLGKMADNNVQVRLNVIRVYREYIAGAKEVPHAFQERLLAALQRAAQDDNADVRAAAQEALKLLDGKTTYDE
ncbi:MAG TPA: HEAT repeat domain-containing protein [bacterium]|nr:HEAT repeat domain-containing protein [bacterium]